MGLPCRPEILSRQPDQTERSDHGHGHAPSLVPPGPGLTQSKPWACSSAQQAAKAVAGSLAAVIGRPITS